VTSSRSFVLPGAVPIRDGSTSVSGGRVPVAAPLDERRPQEAGQQ
jgi:hypothetical protein